MSIVEPDRHSIRKFLTVACPCGRSLRAPVELAGQEISCWECHQKVYVPFPHSPERAFRIITETLRDLFDLRWLLALFLVAALLTGLFCLPGIGIPASALVLILGAVGYGELIRQSGIDVWDFDDWKRPGNLALRIGVAALFGLALASPLLFNPAGMGRPPRFTTTGLLLGLAASMVLPLAMFLIYARDGTGLLGWGRGRKLLLRYPVATLLALLLIPIGLMAAELALIIVTSWQGMFPFLVLDLFPDSEYFARQYGIPKYGNYTKPELPGLPFYRLYFRRVHHGYMLIGALPATLSKKTLVLGSPWTLELTDPGYLKFRAMYNQLSTMVILFSLALQSFWLGAISTLDTRRSEPRPT